MSEHKNGTVARFNAIKGYGFIIDEDNTEYFVHFSNIKAEGYKSLEPGSAVRFSAELSDKGLKAVNVELI